MKQELIDNNFLVIRKFITTKRAKTLSKEFKEFCIKNDVKSDPVIPNSPSKYNYISFLELLCEKTPEVTKIVEEAVVPTYSYARVYKNGDILDRHKDRDPCDISLTVHLDGDEDWKIYIKTPSGDEVGISLKCGDALVYFGCDAEHWRNEFTGSFYSQVFLHYVRTRTNRSYAYFDNRNKNIFLQDLKFLETIEKTNNKKEFLLSETKLEDYIFTFDNIITDEFCDIIINEYKNDSDLGPALISGGKLNTSTRNCYTLNLSFEKSILKNYELRKLIDENLFKASSRILEEFRSNYQYLSIKQDTGYNFLSYETGGFYTEHVDSFAEEPREISCSFILNDDYEGGEFAFFDKELKYRLKKGSAIAFPSNYMFPHEILPVTKGTRYSIITWFV